MTYVSKENIFNNFPEGWEIDEYHFFNTLFSEKNWLTLHTEYNEISTLELGVPFLDDENYDWPK